MRNYLRRVCNSDPGPVSAYDKCLLAAENFTFPGADSIQPTLAFPFIRELFFMEEDGRQDDLTKLAS